VRHLAPLLLPGPNANVPVSTPCTVLIPLDVRLSESDQLNAALGKPTVEGQCVPRFDVDDAGRVLLLNQRSNKVLEMARQWAGGAADERSGTLIRSIHDALLRAGTPAKEDRYVQRREHQSGATSAHRTVKGHSPAREIVQPIARGQ